jgi:hypothetical protein
MPYGIGYQYIPSVKRTCFSGDKDIMKEKGSEKIKSYIVIILAIVLVISFYFRFIRAKVTENRKPGPVASAVQSIDPPRVDRETSEKGPVHEHVRRKLMERIIRDIFSPLHTTEKASDPLTARDNDFTGRKPAVKLRGTIIGKDGAIAIIDGRFVRQGDYVDDYRVAYIGEKHVLLEANGVKIKLELY